MRAAAGVEPAHAHARSRRQAGHAQAAVGGAFERELADRLAEIDVESASIARPHELTADEIAALDRAVQRVDSPTLHLVHVHVKRSLVELDYV